jgi:DNA repair protein RadA/Sms
MEQIATRAQRLITNHASQRPKLPAQLYLLAETNLNVLSDQVLQAWMMAEQPQNDIYSDSNTQPHSVANAPPSLIVIDSIQTMVCEQGGMSSAGGMVQVRECMAFLLRLAKTTNIPILTIGHVTKEGSVAGPRMVEHMVDAVLYLEHDTSNNNNHFRWLRAQKNRFGSCQAVGLYDFQDGRLVPMPEGATAIQSSLPSTDMEGSALSICMEGQHRALTVEVQSLVTVASASFGKKTVEGIPFSRLNLLLGVLQKHCQLSIAGSGKGVSRDVYVNVVGSVSKSQQASTAPGLDLAVAIALASTYLRIPVRGDTVFVAQVGLLGELRPVLSLEARLLQAQRMGFSRIIVASGNMGDSMGKGRQKIDSGVRQSRKYDLDVVECATLSDALDLGLVARIPKRTKGMKSSKGEANSNITPNPTLSIEELYLNENIILDDEDDDDNDLGP